MLPAGFLPRARVLFSQLGSSKPLSLARPSAAGRRGAHRLAEHRARRGSQRSLRRGDPASTPRERLTALPPAGVRGPQPSALKLPGRTFISARNVQKWVRSRGSERKAAAPWGAGRGDLHRPHGARRTAAFRKSRWRCGPLPARPRKPPPADTRPRKVRGPSRAGGAREAG